MATAPPIVSPLPQAPNRNDAPADFSSKADTFVAALPPMVAQENSLATWMYTTSQEVAGYVTTASNAANAAASSASAANGSKNAAAQSAIDATNNGAQQVTLATQQVALAQTAANNAQASATAAESAPGSIGNLALMHSVALSF